MESVGTKGLGVTCGVTGDGKEAPARKESPSHPVEPAEDGRRPTGGLVMVRGGRVPLRSTATPRGFNGFVRLVLVKLMKTPTRVVNHHSDHDDEVL